MGIFNDMPLHTNQEPVTSVLPVASAIKLNDVASNIATLLNQRIYPEESSATVLTLLVLAREVAENIGVETVRKRILQELDPSIDTLIDSCGVTRQNCPEVQRQDLGNPAMTRDLAALDLRAPSFTLGIVGKKLCDIAGRIQGGVAAATICGDMTAQCSSDRTLVPPTSPLRGVACFSSSLNECWFW